ncbi:hypothetical protein AB3S75_035125 [Citrus x aurantiifolia]
MGAKNIVDHLIQKLENPVLDEAKSSNPKFEKQVQDIKSLKESLKDEDQDYVDLGLASARLLEAVYSVEDVTDTLLIRKEFPDIKIRENLFKKFISPLMCFTPSSSSIQIDYLTDEMTKFMNQIRDLSTDHSVNKNEAATTILNLDDVVGGIAKETMTMSFHNKQQQQRWQRISGLRFEEEMNIVVGNEERIKELASLIIPENNLEVQKKKLVSRLFPAYNHDENDDNDQPNDQAIITEFLLQDPDLDRHHSAHQVIAIVGEEGSGKTILARTVYDRVDVKRHFAKRAWVRVRGEAKVRDVLIDILQQIDDDTLVEASAPEAELASSLTTLLKEISYLIVVEDVETPQVWQVLRDALYASSKDSKIILTTSNLNNLPPEAEAAGPTLHLSRLNKEESWKLLLKKVPVATAAESDDDLNNNSESINTFKERILEICGGLPLHISLLGGLLSTKEAKYWSKVIEHADNSRSGSGTGSGVSLLALSYKELPSQLKPFFLYVGIFPRGFEIPVRRLIHLWCAEGFAAPIDTDLAEMYFEELVVRNLIQVTKWRLDGSPKMCRMPSAVYSVFSEEAEKAGFFHHQFTKQQQSPFAVRRLAVYLSGGVNTKLIPSSFLDRSWHLRTYVAFDNRIYCSPAVEISMFLDKIISNRGLVLLTVLDLEGVYKPKLSDHVIGKLLHLSYLGLRSTFIDSLPNSVGNLRYLETLDVKHTKLRYLPDSIWKAKKLQHLYLNWIHSAISWLNFSWLNNLQTLWGLSMGYDSLFNPTFEFTKLASLRKLGVKCYSQGVIDSIAELVSRSTRLQSLKLVYAWRDDYSDIPFKAQANLQELYLRGALRMFSAKTSSFPRNLKIVTLSMSRLYWDPMEALEKLCHLNILRIIGEAYEGKKMTCQAGGFPQLRVLKLWNLSSLEEWTVQEAAMPRLRELEIRSCNKLKPPEGLRNLAATLKDFVLTNMPSTFGEEAQRILQGTDVYIQKNQWPPFLSLG